MPHAATPSTLPATVKPPLSRPGPWQTPQLGRPLSRTPIVPTSSPAHQPTSSFASLALAVVRASAPPACRAQDGVATRRYPIAVPTPPAYNRPPTRPPPPSTSPFSRKSGTVSRVIRGPSHPCYVELSYACTTSRPLRRDGRRPGRFPKIPSRIIDAAARVSFPVCPCFLSIRACLYEHSPASQRRNTSFSNCRPPA
jgi:hypothetical protein